MTKVITVKGLLEKAYKAYEPHARLYGPCTEDQIKQWGEIKPSISRYPEKFRKAINACHLYLIAKNKGIESAMIWKLTND